MSYIYEYPRPAVTADAVILAGNGHLRKVLLIQRGRPPYQGMWALPGGFVDMDEDIDDAVVREVREETGLQLSGYQQLKAFGHPGRDPRHRTITIAYLLLIDQPLDVRGQDDAAEAGWFDIHTLPPLAFDHDHIIHEALERISLQSK